MPRSRFRHVVFVLFVIAVLAIIGRNVYRRHLNNALMDAVEVHNAASVRTLLSRGADANAIVKASPLFARAMALLETSSSRQPSPEAEQIALLLIQNGAGLRMPNIFVDRNDRPHITGYDNAGYLAQACRQGSLTVIQCLLSKGVVPTPECLTSALDYGNPVSFGVPAVYSPSSAAPPLSEANKRVNTRRADVSRQMTQMLRAYGLHPTIAQCVKLKDIALLKAELEAGASPSHEENGQDPLSIAVSMSDLEAMKLLLAHGADVNGHSQNSGRPLCDAVDKGSVAMVNLLLAKGAKVNIGTYRTPLWSALIYKHGDLARLLLAKGADPNFVPGNGASDTLVTAINSMPELVPELLRRGAKVSGDHGDILCTALRSRRLPLVKALLQQGAEVNYKPPAVDPSKPYASVVLGAAGVRYGLDIGRDPMHPGKQLPLPFSPLLTAAYFCPAAEPLLRKAGANIGTDKDVAMGALAQCGRTDLFAHTLGLGADINGADDKGETALTQAVQHAPEAVPFLLAHGANPNAITRSQKTPLILAAQAGNVDCARLLLAHGAKINLLPPRGHTALYWARKSNMVHAVRIMDMKNQRPVTVQRGTNNTEIITLLQQAGGQEE